MFVDVFFESMFEVVTLVTMGALELAIACPTKGGVIRIWEGPGGRRERGERVMEGLEVGRRSHEVLRSTRLQFDLLVPQQLVFAAFIACCVTFVYIIIIIIIIIFIIVDWRSGDTGSVFLIFFDVDIIKVTIIRIAV